MHRLGLLGRDIQHSKSGEVYQDILNTTVKYELFDYEKQRDIPSLDFFFKQVQGLSITSPFKEHFIGAIELSEEATKAGAINCIRFENKKYLGFNTDYLACLDLIESDIVKSSHQSILVLGRGPMARVICSIFDDKDIDYFQLSRSVMEDINEFDLSSFNSNKICIVNCCSRGFLFKPLLVNKVSFFWDLNYGQDHLYIPHYGNAYKNGLELLYLQAKYALKVWEIK